MNISVEKEKVLKVIADFQPVRTTELLRELKISKKNLHKHLRVLLDTDVIEKSGSVPKVFYSIAEKIEIDFEILEGDKDFIDKHYLYLSPSGDILRGWKGFVSWCKKNKLDIEKEKRLYIKQIREIAKFKRDGLISAKKLILSGKGGKDLALDNIFFSDFYTVGHFGKTKLGQLVYAGKSSQDRKLIGEIVELVKPAMRRLMEKYDIKMVGFVPPTIDRKVQFMDVFESKLGLDLVSLRISKSSGDIKIPQKTLRKLEDRIMNAKKTISVAPSQEIIGNVLIIDDATGSGATLNETARKVRAISGKKFKIFGYSIVGSYKGFDVISEV